MSASNTFGYFGDEQFKAELKKMVTVVEHGTGGGYEWDDFVAYWHPERRRFFYLGGSGCSCNSIDDGVTSLSDFRDVGTLGELVEALKRDKGRDFGWSQAQLLAAINEIMNFRG